MASEWILDQTDSERFPYLLTITEQGEVRQQFLVQDSWPAEGKNTFCLRPERHTEPWRCVARKERVAVKRLMRRGKLLTVVLERSLRKRCEFLFTEKAYKNRPGTYEQIFWRTQEHFRQRPASIRTGTSVARDVEILVDTNERYPFKFPNSRREKLPVGDYAVVGPHGELRAVVERKRFEDFLSGLNAINTLHMTLAELAAYPAAAMTVEAPYHYFLDRNKLGPYGLQAPRAEYLIMELFTTHPGIHLVFLENRKVAERWCGAFLRRCAALPAAEEESAVAFAEAGGEYNLPEYSHPKALIRALPEFSFDQLRVHFPGWSESQLRNLLTKYRKQGWLVCYGKGINARWKKVDQGNGTEDPK